MYKKLLLFTLAPVIGNDQIPVEWDIFTGLSLGAAIATGGSYLSSQFTGENAQAVGRRLFLGGGAATAAWYIITRNPGYRFCQVTNLYNNLIEQPLTPVLKRVLKKDDVHDLLEALSEYYADSANPYYQAFADMVALRKTMHTFLLEIEILTNHFYQDEAKSERLALYQRKIEVYEKLYARALVMLKSTVNYRRAIHLQQEIEQNQRLSNIERQLSLQVHYRLN